jgi:DNA segregation ATPase FtsK/SpoIIIE, S-DNA-T family
VKEKKHEIWALVVLTLTLLVVFSLVSFHSADQTIFSSSSTTRPPVNWVGFLGAHIARFFFNLIGIGAYGFVYIGFWLSWVLFRGTAFLRYGKLQIFGLSLLILTVISIAALHSKEIHIADQVFPTGGIIGGGIAYLLARQMYSVGAHILLVGIFFIALLLSTPLTLKSLLDWAGKCCSSVFRGIFATIKGILRGIFRFRRTSAPVVLTTASRAKKPPPPVQILLPAPAKKTEKKKAADPSPPPPVPPVVAPGQYVIPPFDLLDDYETETEKPDWKKLEQDAAVLEEKLADFGVQGKVIGICPGPVITMYEYAPAPGIKISRIVGLSDDLSMALKATSIRVVAPIPGKAAIGIELPNLRREMVYIRAVLESEAFGASTAALTMALGKDIMGQPVVANLARMPHLLIAGATGTGKSVCINSLLTSFLYRNTPDEIRFLLIDPKRIELNSYEGIPHLIHPVVTDAKMATRALRWAVEEMELRYKLLADKNVRNIESYNRALAREKAPKPKPDELAGEEPALKHHRLPYIVIIIDELADLMMVASRDVEESITRLAQMARAAGLHLILATQRPSVDVLTGIIKANIPTRVSFQVSSRIDSRTILDTSGAESLLGSGDMLFLPPGTAKLQRIHGAFISDNEVLKLTQFWRAQQLVEDPLRERVDFQDSQSGDEIAEEELDDKYEEAVQLVIETRQASISMLQRRLRVGYNRAARMIEVMEQQGIVGASDGVKPREVLGKRN